LKSCNPKTLKPNSDDFHRFTEGKLSEAAQQSISGKATAGLFRSAQKLYSLLDSLTCERLSLFVDNQTYLSPTQEHDLIALTALYAGQMDMQLVREIIDQDLLTTDAEKQVLRAAVDHYQISAASTCAVLGNPHWIEDCPTTQTTRRCINEG
jgi:hypothetical protein